MSLHQIPEGYGHYFARPRDHQWARPSMHLFLIDLSASWAISYLSSPFALGDISLKNGMAPPVHHTHVWGSCVDIYIFHAKGLRRQPIDGIKNKVPRNVADITDPNSYDKKLTLKFAERMIHTLHRGYHPVQLLLDDNDIKTAFPLITSSESRPHTDHFHLQLGDKHPYSKAQASKLLGQSYTERFFGL